MKSIITITGMPGSGKSYAAKELAAQLSASGQPASWIDLDAEVERRAGKSIARIFADDGEAAFRSLEKSCLKSLFPDGNSFDLQDPLVAFGDIPPSRGWHDLASQTVSTDTEYLVIALGGGTLLDSENLELVRKNSYCIWLDTPLEEIAERLWARGNIGQRPLLASAKTKKELLELLHTLYNSRKSAYQAAAKEIR